MDKYYVYISTDDERACPYYDTLSKAIEKYKAIEMKKLGDCVFLGYENTNMCFDVLHKFFNDNVLINDYINHDAECHEIVQRIIGKFDVRYQWTSDILDGVLIDFQSRFAPHTGTADEKWNEAYLSTCRNNALEIVGWVAPTRETFNNYSWNYPKTASYISMMNVPVYDDRGRRHDVDIDPRVYLQMTGKKVSIAKEW